MHLALTLPREMGGPVFPCSVPAAVDAVGQRRRSLLRSRSSRSRSNSYLPTFTLGSYLADPWILLYHRTFLAAALSP